MWPCFLVAPVQLHCAFLQACHPSSWLLLQLLALTGTVILFAAFSEWAMVQDEMAAFQQAKKLELTVKKIFHRNDSPKSEKNCRKAL